MDIPVSNSPQATKRRFWPWLIVILILVGLGFFAWTNFKNSAQKVENSKTVTKQGAPKKDLSVPPAVTVTKKQVETAKLPSGLPSDVPIEAGAKILQNYTATTSDGKIQATRIFETSKSLDDNAKVYTDYLVKNNWKITTKTTIERLRSIAAVKGDLYININIGENSVTKVRTVDISILQTVGTK